MKRIYAQRCGSNVVHLLTDDVAGKRTVCGRKVSPGRWGVYEGRATGFAAQGVALCLDCDRMRGADTVRLARTVPKLCSACDPNAMRMALCPCGNAHIVALDTSPFETFSLLSSPPQPPQKAGDPHPMNQEIKAALARASTLPPSADPIDLEFESLFRGPQTLGTVGAALATCPHPMRCQVDGRVARDGQTEEIVWCAACGAMAIGHLATGIGPQWERCALVQQLTSEQFGELGAVSAGLQGAIHSTQAKGASATRRPPSAEWRMLENALRALAALTLFREMKGVQYAQRLLAIREQFEASPVSS
jgi:hypothetical protein